MNSTFFVWLCQMGKVNFWHFFLVNKIFSHLFFIASHCKFSTRNFDSIIFLTETNNWDDSLTLLFFYWLFDFIFVQQSCIKASTECNWCRCFQNAFLLNFVSSPAIIIATSTTWWLFLIHKGKAKKNSENENVRE